METLTIENVRDELAIRRKKRYGGTGLMFSIRWCIGISPTRNQKISPDHFHMWEIVEEAPVKEKQMKILTKELARDGMTLEFFQNSGRHTLRKKPDGSWAVIPHGDANITALPESDFDMFMIVEEAPAEITKRCENCDWNDKSGMGMQVYCEDCKARGPDSWWKPISPPEPPLVALGPDSTDKLGIGHPDASSVDLKALSDLISETMTIVEAQMECIDDHSHAYDLAEEAVDKLADAQLLLGDKAVTRKVESDAAQSVLEGFRPLVDEAMDRMNELSKTVDLSDDEGEQFDAVTGILLAMKRGIVPQAATTVDLKALSGFVDGAIWYFESIRDGNHWDENAKRIANEAVIRFHRVKVLLGDKASTRMATGVQPGSMDDTAAMPKHLKAMTESEDDDG